jgi:hypothetical protein
VAALLPLTSDSPAATSTRSEIPKSAGAAPAVASKQKQKAAKVTKDDDSIENSGSPSQSDGADEDQWSGDEGSVDLDAEVRIYYLALIQPLLSSETIHLVSSNHPGRRGPER